MQSLLAKICVLAIDASVKAGVSSLVITLSFQLIATHCATLQARIV